MVGSEHPAVPVTLAVPLRTRLRRMFLTGLAMWMPVLAPLPEVEKLPRPMQMVYLMGHSVLPIVPAAFLTFSATTIYPIYETFPRFFGWTAVEDQTIAGIIMKLAGTFTLWGVITVIWFRWSAEQAEIERLERLLALDSVNETTQQ